jgi:DNA-binding NarL/FixJ family response regulator
MSLRILIADDHVAVRRALKHLLESHASWQVCGEAANGFEAVEKTAELNPDVVILDYRMPKMNGFQAASEICSSSPQVPILIYTQFDGAAPEVKLELKNACIRKIIGKESPKELLSALEAL